MAAGFSVQIIYLNLVTHIVLEIVVSSDHLNYPFDFVCKNKAKEILKIHFLIAKFLF